jgi:hypothetical protein
MRALRASGFIAVTALAVAACGGSTNDDDDDEVTCGPVQGCGGDVVGVWTVVDLCVTATPPADLPECEGAVAYGDLDASGQIELTADGRAVSSLDLTLHATYSFSEECLSAQAGAPITVDQSICDRIEQEVATAENVTSASCTVSGSTCVCPTTFHSSTAGEGTYVVDGTNLLDADGNVMPYCVSGDTLRFSGDTDVGTLTYVVRRVTR